MTRILFLGGNIARSLSDWLERQGEQVIYRDDKVTIGEVASYAPDWIVSYNYRYLISRAIIDAVHGNAINLHISLLPYNRGAYPNAWSFLEETSKGVTIHYIDEGVDTGDILIQKEVEIDEETETLKSSYDKLQREIQILFKANWEKIKHGDIFPQPQSGGGGPFTTVKSSQNLPTASPNKAGRYQSKRSKNDFGLKMRHVQEQDKEEMFQWRNHPDVRKHSFYSEPLMWEEHEQWFTTKLHDRNVAMYMAYSDSEKIGTIRYEHAGKHIRVSVMLNPKFIGQGLGAKIIKLGTQQFIHDKAPEESIIAEIKPDNIASIKAFQKAGFNECYRTYAYKPFTEI